MHFDLPKDFLLGVSAAADQIEGGDVDSNWNDWFKQGKIKDGSSPANANDHWVRWKEDIDIMANLGVQCYRMGLEWPRIEPREGEFDEAVIDRYREEISYMIGKGIKPLVTIHHFGNPMWFERKGGFTKKENLDYFLEYGKYIVERLADLVSDWITINEPNVYAMNGYFGGGWPPGHNSFFEYRDVISNLAYCHIALYTAIHIQREALGYSDTMVSFANHLRVFNPEDPKKFIHRFACNFAERCFQGALTKAMLTGQFSFPVKNNFLTPEGEYADFIGVNYYSRSMISGFKDGVAKTGPKNDLGWEIYSRGIEDVSRFCYEILPRPIWVTENGTCDNNDAFRSRYVAEHLEVVLKSDLPFERYYHWSFSDNFEWIEGESARFGLVHVDYKTQERTLKNSALMFKEILAERGLTEEMYVKHVALERYHE